MAKYNAVLGLEGQEPGKRSVRLRVLLFLLVVTSPLLFEAGKVVTSRWYGMMGRSYEAPTPIWDAISRNWETGSINARRQIAWRSGYGHWTPAMAVPIAFACALFGSLFLKRGH